MTGFLEYLRRRRAELHKELEELEVAERLYREAASSEPEEVPSAEYPEQPPFMVGPGYLSKQVQRWKAVGAGPKTIKQQVVAILDEIYPAGLTALEILDRINKRWNAHLERTTLSPQLTRLKRDGAIHNDKTKWYLVVKDDDAPSAEADGAS